MKKVKKQHYVPQFYLKRFTKDGNSLFVFDKIEKRIFETNMINVANERYFYDITWHGDLSTLDTQLIEKELARIETLFSENIELLLAEVEKRKNFAKTDMSTLGNFIVIQWLRTKNFRTAYIEDWKKMIKGELNKELKARNIKISENEYEIRIKEDFQKVMHNHIIFNWNFLFKVLNLIKNHIWFIGINNTSINFITSDNPVVKKPHLTSDGIASKGIEIALPLSLRYILILWERSYFKDFINLDCKAKYLSISKVKYYNNLQLQQSYRQVFSHINNLDNCINGVKSQQLTNKYK